MSDEHNDDQLRSMRFLDPVTGEAREENITWEELAPPDRVTMLFWLWYGELASHGYALPDLTRGTIDAAINLIARYCPDDMVEPVLDQVVLRLRRGVPSLRLDRATPKGSA